MNYIKKTVSLSFLSLSLLSTNPICCDEFDDLDNIENFDVFLESDLVNDYLETNEFVVLKSFSPSQIMGVLEALEFRKLLQEDFYLRTNRLNNRSILDLPLGSMDKDYEYNRFINAWELFYNMTDRSYFTWSCDAISSYLALQANDFMEKLREASEKVEKLREAKFDFDPADAFALFKNATIQERRLGILLYGRASIKRWRFSWKLPIYYLERNIWLTEEEQEKIEEVLGQTTEEAQEQFECEHAISDKFGIGDTRVGFDFPISEDSCSCTRLGFHLTVPTAWAPAKGLSGSHFKPFYRSANANLKDITGYHLEEILNLALESKDEPEKLVEATQILTDLGYDILDHLSANIMEMPLGNGGHLGIGGGFSFYSLLSRFVPRPWAERIDIRGFLSLEYLLPAMETRFFGEVNDSRIFDDERFKDESRAQENLIFLEEQLVAKLFPFATEVKVHPGVIFRYSSRWCHERENWGIQLGSDYWIRSREGFSDIVINDKNLNDRLKIECARRPRAFQAKILGSLFWKRRKNNKNWIISLTGETTTWNKGIGGDFTVSLDFEIDF